MKRILCLLLIISCLFGLAGCSSIEKNSLEEYAEKGGGYSSFELDQVDCLLPSSSFLGDYDYYDGDYYMYDHGFFEKKHSVSFLYLKYDEEIYLDAKGEMLEKIKPYNDKFYYYNNYVFYENSNFIRFNGARSFPEWFTMACFNDGNCTLMFIGFYYAYFPDEISTTDIEENFGEFLEEYYGEHYDFSK